MLSYLKKDPSPEVEEGFGFKYYCESGHFRCGDGAGVIDGKFETF